jgi:tetratricopeptide (TPR) repeat protein
MVQLVDENQKINPQKAADILRNKEGMDNLPLGYGNEKALNQLLAHHGIIFKPEQRLVWVSSNPYQLGEFVCYDLNTIFRGRNVNNPLVSLEKEDLNIAADSFLETKEYKNYELFRVENKKMDVFLNNRDKLPLGFIDKYQSLNPDYWEVYYKAGKYLYNNKEYELAQEQFRKALSKEITSVPEKEEVEKYLRKSKRKK